MNKHHDKKGYQYLLIGAPNVGKSTFYNKVTWKISPVGNVDRVTTCALSARLRNDFNTKVIDLPGIVSLNSISEDEAESFDYILNSEYNGVINIIGTNSIKRDLLLTYELAEAGILSMIQINMIDEMKGFNIDKISLTSEFGVIVNEISSKKNINIKNSLLPIVNRSVKNAKPMVIKYNDKIEKFIDEFKSFIPNNKLSSRFIISQAICDNEIIIKWLEEKNIYKDYLRIKEQLKINQDDVDNIRDAKQKLINNLIKKVIHSKDNTNKISFIRDSKFQIFLDKIFLNKYWSIPIFILIIALIWFVTFYGYTGGWLQSMLADEGFGKLQEIISNEISKIDPSSIAQAWWSKFVSDGMLGGIFTILSFIPWILILTFCMSVLEQIGIISRMCIVFDRLFSKFGISGRSVINLIVGVGCNVPSIIMAKNSNSLKEKIVTVMIMPFVSCSARVIVYGFIANIFVGDQFSWLFNLGISAISVLVALFFGYFFSNNMFRKKSSFFISELNPYRSPDLFVVFKKMIMECYDFLKRVILVIAVCNLIIWVLSYTGPKNIILDVNDDMSIQHSFLRYISIPFQLLMYPTGMGEHWKLSISLVTAFPAKEIASTNIATIFGGTEGFNDFLQNIRLPVSTILSFITFFTFYIPCMATIFVMVKEIGKKYTLFHILTSLIGSWLMSILVFSTSGLIESAVKYNTVSISSSLISIMFLFSIFYIFIYLYKFIKFKKDLAWSYKQILGYKLANWINTCCLVGFVLTADIFLLLKH